MSLDEKRSHNSLHEVMGPFIVDTGDCYDWHVNEYVVKQMHFAAKWLLQWYKYKWYL
jgi:hypothetical protein